jgi:hypothetical protein
VAVVRVTVESLDRSDCLLASMSSYDTRLAPFDGCAMVNQRAPCPRRSFLLLWAQMFHQSALSSIFPSYVRRLDMEVKALTYALLIHCRERRRFHHHEVH